MSQARAVELLEAEIAELTAEKDAVIHSLEVALALAQDRAKRLEDEIVRLTGLPRLPKEGTP